MKTAQLKEHEQTHAGNPENTNSTQRTLSVSNKDLMFVVFVRGVKVQARGGFNMHVLYQPRRDLFIC